MGQPPAKIAFVHIPRTAGMTFGRILEELYRGGAIRNFYADETDAVVNNKIERFVSLGSSAKNAFDILKGHFVFGFDPSLTGFNYVTLLRQPVERLISYYFYALRDRDNYLHPLLIQRRMRLEQFLMSDLSIELDNYQVRAVSGLCGRAPVCEPHLAAAKKNLRHGFAAFGLCEQFDRSMRRLARAFGWRMPPYTRQNSAEYSRDTALSAVCMDHVVTRNRFDLELYRYAQELFSQQEP